MVARPNKRKAWFCIRMVRTLAAGSPSRARNIAGIAVNGWVIKPPHTSTSARPSETFTGDVWARRHLGMTTAEFSGIILAIFIVLLLLPFLIYYLVKRKQRGRKANLDSKGTNAAGNGPRNSSISTDPIDLNPTRDVELSDLDSSGTRVASSAGTVVRHTEHLETHSGHHSERKIEGSSTMDGDDRTA